MEISETYPRNPKMEGVGIWDCRPQVGKCPVGCNQCFYNREGAFYCDINKPHVPDPADVGNDIVRMNTGHDSNLLKELVIETARKYRRCFFNTSISDFDFPGPVVFTANRKEEEPAWCPVVDRAEKTRQIHSKQEQFFDRLMFVRLRVSPTNLELIEHAVAAWTAIDVPVVLTFMSYYDQAPPGTDEMNRPDYGICYGWKSFVTYQWKKRHTNSYYCPTFAFICYVLKRMQGFGGRLVTMCGTPKSNWCRDCQNCKTYYIQTAKRLEEKGI
ncbi:MAG: hypothetical protein ACTSPB_13570 [Candidatus Thorarchaeota archaeon]